MRMKRRKKNPKNEDSVSNLWSNFKHSNIRFIEMPEGEEKEQEIENLFEKIMKENFLSFIIPFIISFLSFTWVGEGNRHASPWSIESPKEDGHKEATLKTHHN